MVSNLSSLHCETFLLACLTYMVRNLLACHFYSILNIKLLVPIHKLKRDRDHCEPSGSQTEHFLMETVSFKYMVPSSRDTDTRLTFNCRRSSLAKMSKRDSSKIAAPQSTPLRLGCRNSPKTLRHKQRRFPSRSPSPVTWRFSHRN